MRFEVPQFIDIENKIFGPLTWRQFVWLGGGVGLAVVLFLTTPFLVFALLGVPIAILGAALSFYPVNNRPFSFFLEAFYSYTVGAKQYQWRQKQIGVYTQTIDRGQSAQQPHTEIRPPQPKDQSAGVVSLARRLELEAMQKAE
ncbi:MAG: PrgI family protein [Patescibacteria group bacterium]